MNEARKVSTRELVLRLTDTLNNGIRYNKKRNEYVLVWSPRMIRKMRRAAKKFADKIKLKVE